MGSSVLKPMLYQLSYVRVGLDLSPSARRWRPGV
jgi:hypothetical protein